ncbi:hypothetical protein C7374_11444 [Falsochrobactrum ovis]|uniref:Uncharacterized protein n=1 Tax=Falsochrobactrum ovis TaxID=1293442 RepID=A0A364JT51_9HYPH|nr:hypothetical protein C7374_11444 [Falsochrobactrum ovis]
MQPNAAITTDPMLDVALSYTARITDLPYNRRPRHAYSCPRRGDTATLGKVKCANGTIQYKAFCAECGGRGAPFSHQEMAHLDDTRIPVIIDHPSVPCERCGSTNGVEEHHWAPWHLFDDAHNWPTSFLCMSCHQDWHAKVTPNMNSHKATK